MIAQPRKMVNDSTALTRKSSRVVVVVSSPYAKVEECGATNLLALLDISSASLSGLLLALSLLQEGLWHEDLVLCWDRSKFQVVSMVRLCKCRRGGSAACAAFSVW